jgi:hypothetical protein
LIPFIVRQTHHERNQHVAVRPELIEGLVQRYLYQLSVSPDKKCCVNSNRRLNYGDSVF